METRFSNDTARQMALVGAAAWLLLATAWQASNTLEQARDWEGLPQALFFVGLIGLLVGGLALGVMALDPVGRVRRPTGRVVGLVLLAAGLAMSFIAGWAVPVWAAAYGLAMLTLAFSGSLGRTGWIAGAALTAASASWFLLTTFEVGTADSFGDYPIAWITATWLAAVGSAAGLFLHARELKADRGALMESAN